MRRTLVMVGAVVVLVGLSACSLGAKQAMTDRVIAAAERVRAGGAADGVLSVQVKVVPARLPVAPGPPRIVNGAAVGLVTAIDFKNGRAAVAYDGTNPATAAMVFVGSRIYQRTGIKAPAPTVATVPNLQAVAAQATRGAPVAVAVGGGGVDSNLVTLSAAAARAAQPKDPTTPAAPGTSTTSTSLFSFPTTTTSTSVPPASGTSLHRPIKIQRNWVALDYASLPKRDSTKSAGSYAISPIVIERLVTGALTGSVKQRSTQSIAGVAMTRYTMNVSRDKAERHLTDGQRQDLDKIFRANAIGRRVFPADVWIDPTGTLRHVEVRMRQTLSRIDRADLIIDLDLAPASTAVLVPVPDGKTTAVVKNLGLLIHGAVAS
jgi:hypothetical protein